MCSCILSWAYLPLSNQVLSHKPHPIRAFLLDLYVFLNFIATQNLSRNRHTKSSIRLVCRQKLRVNKWYGAHKLPWSLPLCDEAGGIWVFTWWHGWLLYCGGLLSRCAYLGCCLGSGVHWWRGRFCRLGFWGSKSIKDFVLQQVLGVDLLLLKDDIDGGFRDVVYAAVEQIYALLVLRRRFEVGREPLGVFSHQQPRDEHGFDTNHAGEVIGIFGVPGKVTP